MVIWSHHDYHQQINVNNYKNNNNNNNNNNKTVCFV